MPTSTIYRALLPSEIAAATDVFIASMSDMLRRNGVPPPPVIREPRIAGYRHILETGIFEVAEVDRQIVAICCAIVRGNLWFLSGFWTLPGMQSSGLGRPLLERVWKAGQERGAKTFRTWSSIDAAALSVYMRQTDQRGRKMMPRSQIFTFCGVPKFSTSTPSALELTPFDLEIANQIDGDVYGAVREEDHRFWKGDRFIVRRAGLVAGYFHSIAGLLGPVAWSEEKDAADVLATAMHHAARQANEIRFSCPGINHAAIDAALTTRLRLTGTAHLLSTDEIGRMEQYIPSGALLF
jgi:hypothetical protein